MNLFEIFVDVVAIIKKGLILPNVIEFVSQYPEYLRIISHCTRKSEVAIWPYLFSIAGNSRLLFEVIL